MRIAVEVRSSEAKIKAMNLITAEHDLMLETLLQLHSRVNGCGFEGQIIGDTLKKLGVKP